MSSSTHMMPLTSPKHHKIHVKHTEQGIINAKTVLCCKKCSAMGRNDGSKPHILT